MIEYCEFCGDTFSEDHDCSIGSGEDVLLVREENLVGTILDGRYEIVERLGEGGMARVYRAIDHRLPKDVAIKILLDKLLIDIESLRRFQAEALAVSKLSHPNIISISDFGGYEGRPYYVMELIQGRTLSHVIKSEGTLSDEQFVNVFTQLCMGLAHAHNRGVVHRDLKPSNILIFGNAGEEMVKLVDFGIAKVLVTPNQQVSRMPQKITATGVIIGSPLYMSPEQCRGTCDRRSDIYSLGCTMFESLTGRPPFKGRSAIATMHMQMHDVAPSLRVFDSSITTQIEEIVQKALEKDPDRRYQNTDELEQALQSIPISQPGASYEAIKARMSESQIVQASSQKSKKIGKSIEPRKLSILIGSGVALVLLVFAVTFFSPQYYTTKHETLSENSPLAEFAGHNETFI
ncbi:MAG: serine/threonine protein kinase, partial [Cyanobacteria bacterium]|nr:serine/threonine protein kinase [Cyanobacteriota bacterium]